MGMNAEELLTQAGGVVKLARLMGVHPTTVSCWRAHGRLPGSRAIQVGRRLGLSLEDVAELCGERRPRRNQLLSQVDERDGRAR